MHVHFWPGSTVNLSGLKNKVLGVKLFAAGTPVKFTQDEFRLQMTGLPATAPDTPVTTLAIECDSVPEQDQNIIRRDRPRFSADISI
jgi:alpha-L-fucosidase